MLSLLNSFFKIIGIDKAIAYSSLARIIQAGGGLLTVFFIAARLSSEEQGYYYTFGSLLAIQVFFELGLGQIITQYVAYEAAYLKLNEHQLLTGDEIYISRLASLWQLFSKWYLYISCLLFVVLLISGLFFFSHYGNTHVKWLLPWILLSFFTALNLLISPALAFIEGLGKVKEVAFMQLVSQSFQILCVWIVLWIGGGLFASAVSSFCLWIISILFISYKGRFFLIQLFKYKITSFISYRKEIFPYQWRIALSWISGYFIFQLFNPVLFAYSGPIVAGQMGMTLTALNGILSLTLSWTSTKIPFWAGCVSRQDYLPLDHSYRKTLKESSVVCLLCILLFIGFLLLLRWREFALYGRFLPVGLSLLLSLTLLVNNTVNMWATYLRCHKKEPFLIQALLIGLLTACSTIFLGKYAGVEGIVIGYTTIVVGISLPLSYYIFKTRRKSYHGA